MVSFAYLRLLIFLPAILIPTCDSSTPAFLMMYSAYKLNKQGDNIQPWRTPFPIRNQSVVPCPVLTVASWPAYGFLKSQAPKSCSHFLVYGASLDSAVGVQLLSCVWLFVTPWTVACQAPLSLGFPRQEYWSGVPFPSPGELPDPGIEPESVCLLHWRAGSSHWVTREVQ